VSASNQVRGHLSAISCSLPLQNLSLVSDFAHAPYFLLKVARQDGFDPDIKRVLGHIQEKGDRVPDRSFDFV
jgi:hypothetical protein